MLIYSAKCFASFGRRDWATKEPSMKIAEQYGFEVRLMSCETRQSTKLDLVFSMLISPDVNKDGGGYDLSCLKSLLRSAFLCCEAMNKLVTILLHVCTHDVTERSTEGRKVFFLLSSKFLTFFINKIQ